MSLSQRANTYPILAERLNALVGKEVAISIQFLNRLDGELMRIPKARVAEVVHHDETRVLDEGPVGAELRLEVGDGALASLNVSQSDLDTYQDDGGILGLEIGAMYVDICPWSSAGSGF